MLIGVFKRTPDNLNVFYIEHNVHLVKRFRSVHYIGLYVHYETE
ncbi:hypothetical protein FB99_40500 (plasmid) [Pantoea agglomerans]|nr:hypothetical protein FB99_40500 [Pantoea agglomerans]